MSSCPGTGRLSRFPAQKPRDQSSSQILKCHLSARTKAAVTIGRLPLSYARPRLAVWIVIAATAYGGAIELIQPTVGRDQDVWDFLADGVGAVAGAAVGVGLHLLRHRGNA